MDRSSVMAKECVGKALKNVASEKEGTGALKIFNFCLKRRVKRVETEEDSWKILLICKEINGLLSSEAKISLLTPKRILLTLSLFHSGNDNILYWRALIDLLVFFGSSVLLSSFHARSVNLSTLFLCRLSIQLTSSKCPDFRQ